MRLTQEQKRLISQTIDRIAGAGAVVYLFGSRLHDDARGGDVDLLIETDVKLSLIERARIKLALESQLGLPVDVISKARDVAPTPFQALARAGASRLEA